MWPQRVHQIKKEHEATNLYISTIITPFDKYPAYLECNFSDKKRKHENYKCILYYYEGHRIDLVNIKLYLLLKKV